MGCGIPGGGCLMRCDGEVMGVVVQEARGGMRWRVCSGVQGDAGVGCGGSRGRSPLASKRAPEGGPCS